MKKLAIVVCLAAIAIGGGWADGFSVSVQNQESWRFWYVLDPPGFAEEEPASPWLVRKAEALLAREGEEFPFVVLEPGLVVTLDGLSAGTHYLLGFFEDESLEELPVRLIALQADASLERRHYDVYALPEILMAARGQGMLARFVRAEPEAPVVEEKAAAAQEQPIAGAGQEAAAEEPAAEVAEAAAIEAPAAEAATEEQPAPMTEEAAAAQPAAEAVEEAPAEEQPAHAAEAPAAKEAPAQEAAVAAAAADEPLATFSESYDPVYFTRESRDGFVVLPMASSRAWGKPGTRLSSFRGSLGDGAVTLVLESIDGFAKNASCFLYVFPRRTAGGTSDFTFEVRPEADGRAAVVLWQKGRAIPRILGTARTEGGELTWTVYSHELPSELAVQLGPATTLDLTTAWLDETSGTWEEFYFTTFAVADLTR